MPLVGREAELSALRDTIARPPSLTVIEGEAGIGKTRLVEQAISDGSVGGPVLRGRSDPVREPSSLGPVLEALAGLTRTPPPGPVSAAAGALRPLLPELGEILPPSPEPLDDRAAARHRVLRGIVALLGAMPRAALVLDDVQWCDEATIELLDLLVRQQPHGLAIVLTVRPEDCDSHRLARLSRLGGAVRRAPLRIGLGPLAAADVGRLVTAVLGGAAPHEPFADQLCQRTGGVPLVVEEVLRTLAQDAVGSDGGATRGDPSARLDDIGVPAVLTAALQERLERVSPAAREVVAAAAVVGARRPAEVLSGMLGQALATTMAALEEAASVGLLAPSEAGGHAFRHPLAQQAVYEGIGEAERERLHLAAARELSRLRPPPMVHIARHLRRGGESPAFVEAAEAAADEAARLGDDMVATSLLLDALAVHGLEGQTRVRLARKLGRTAFPCLAQEVAVAPVRAALDEPAADRAARGELRYWLAQFHYQSGDAAEGYKHMRAALDDVDSPARAARAMSVLSLPVAPQVPVREHLDWAHRAARAAAEADDPAVTAAVGADEAMLRLECGDPTGWALIEWAWSDEASLGARREHARGCVNVAQASLRLGYPDFTRRALDRAKALLDEVGELRLQEVVELVEVGLAWSGGRWADLEQRLLAVVEDPKTPGPAAIDARALIGALRWTDGAPAQEAQAQLGAAAAPARATGSIALLADVASGLADIDLHRGQPEQAVLRTAAALTEIRAKGVWTWAADLVPAHVRALLATGARTTAEAVADEFRSGLVGTDAPRPRAGDALSRALARQARGDAAGAEAAFAEAFEGFERVARPLDIARVLEEWGRARCERSDGADGGGLLADALQRYRALSAARPAARTRALLRQHGLRVPGAVRPPAGAGSDDPLTPREREIARMAATGMTNGEIAAALFLSVRTVETHVSRALRKLGVPSRRHLPRS